MTAWLFVFAAHAAVPVWAPDLGSDPSGLVSGGDPGQWEWGAITTGPESGWTGASAWTTRLGDVHMNDSDDTLTLPSLELDPTAHLVLVMEHWYDLEPGGGDSGQLEGWDGNAWTPIDAVDGPFWVEGSSDGWRTDYFDLSGTPNLHHVRLRFFADTRGARDGWTVGGLRVVDGDPVPPRVVLLTAPTDTQDIVGPYPVRVTATDDDTVSAVNLVWYAGDGARTSLPLSRNGDDTYDGALPGADPGTAMVWWVEATDATGNLGFAPGPTFRVYLPAPTALSAPDGRIVDTHVPLTWTPPDSIWPVDHYQVFRDTRLVATSTRPSVEAPLGMGNNVFTVSAMFATDGGLFEGDPSNAVAVDGYPPAILRIAPASAWPGDTVRVELQGRYLLLQDGDVSLSLGGDITIEDIDVVNVDTLSARIVVSDDAQPATIDALLRTGDITVQAEQAFTIRSGDSRPQVLAVDPPSLLRGAQANVQVRTNVSLPDDTRLVTGAGVIVERISRIDDQTVHATLTVTHDAPLGDQTIEVDVGTRILTGATVSIRNPEPDTKSQCGSLPPTMPGLWTIWGVCVAWARRRKARSFTDFTAHTKRTRFSGRALFIRIKHDRCGYLSNDSQ